MATTKLMPMHRHECKSVLQTLKDSLDYGKNPDKTNDGKLISTLCVRHPFCSYTI